METKGLFSALYTDRGSHYWYTETAGGRVDTVRLTQVHRAWQQLGITLIPAYSPGARGRSERVFRTRQDDCPTSWPGPGSPRWRRRAGISLRSAPPAYHPHFAVPASEARTAFVPWIGTNLTEILCVQEERVVPRATPCGIRGRVCRSHRTHTGSIM